MKISPKVTKISPKVMQTSPKVSIQQHALKGQKLVAQGNPGYKIAFSNAPCKGKSFNHSKNKQLKNQIR